VDEVGNGWRPLVPRNLRYRPYGSHFTDPSRYPVEGFSPRRTPEMGAPVTQWRALLNVNSQQPNAATQLDYAGARVQFEEVNVQTPYFPLELVTTVTRDAVMLARSYADALAVGTLQNLNQVLISEDINLLNATNFALPSIGTRR